MQVNINTKDIELTESLRTYVEKKVGDLERYLQGMYEENDMPEEQSGERDPVMVDVEIGRTTRHHRKGDVYRAEINIDVPSTKRVLRAESKKPDLHLAIDEVKDEMQREIKKYRNKRTDLYRRDMSLLKKVTRFTPDALSRQERKKRKQRRKRE